MNIIQSKHTTYQKIITTALLISTAFFTTIASAGTNSPVIDHKQQHQKSRILQGIKSGELTAHEASKLGKLQGRIYHKEQHFKSDGNFTRRERAKVHRNLAKSSHSIYVQKHDRQSQGNKRLGIKSPKIHHRQKNQKRRIGQGIRSGELTAREASRLGKQQKRIQHKKRHFKADGRFNKRERARIHQFQNRASKNIYRKKHNNKHR